MKLYKWMAALFLSVAAVFLLIPAAASAAEAIDLSRDVRLTISYQDGDVPLAGAEFSIYLVADVDENGELTTTPAFRQFNVDIRGRNDAAWKALARTLEGYVLRDQIEPTDSGATGQSGFLYFPTGSTKLMPGLYLVLGQRHTQNGRRYDATPFMVMLPTRSENTWSYEVIASPKHTDQEIPDTPTDITRKVLKVWDDNGHENSRPKEITIQLLRDGEVYDTVTLNVGNNWRYTWSGLDDDYRWTVVEKELSGYTVRVDQEGITFVVTNTYVPTTPDTPTQPTKPSPSTPGKPSLPQTGQLWWPVPVLMCAGLVLVVAGLLRRRRESNGE